MHSFRVEFMARLYSIYTRTFSISKFTKKKTEIYYIFLVFFSLQIKMRENFQRNIIRVNMYL